MNDLLFSLNIVMPMALMMALGYIFKRIGLFDDPFLRSAKKFCFYVLLSCSLFKNLYDSKLDRLPYRFIIFLVISILLEIILSFVFAKLIAENGKEEGVIAQGSFRSNFAYIGFPLAAMFFTDEALIQRVNSEISLASIFVIPLFNVFAVIALLKGKEEKDGRGMLKRSFNGIIRNPCILSVFAGMTVLLLRILIPSVSFFVKNDLLWVYQALSYLSSMSTPLAFLLVGADMDFSRSVRDIGKLAKVVLLKDLVFPVLFLCAAFILHAADSVEYAILVSVFASPTAVSSAIMAHEMNGDSDLASEIVVYTTLFSILSLLVIIYLLRITGCV